MQMAATVRRWQLIWQVLTTMLFIGMMSWGVAFAQSPEEADVMLPAQSELPMEEQVVPKNTLHNVVLIKEKERIGLRISSEQAGPYRVSMSAASTRLVVDFPDAWYSSEQPQSIPVGSDVVLRSLQVQPLDEQGTQVVLTLAFAVPYWTDSGWVQTEDGMYQLVITAQRQFVQHREFLLQQGVTFIAENRADLSGPISVRALRFSPLNPQVRLGLGLAKGVSIGLETVPAIVRRYGAYAGVNASFFHTSGLALGLLVDDYTLISTPVYDRTALLMLSDGSMGMDRVALQACVNLANETTIAIHGFNRIRKAGEVVVYNSAFGSHTPKGANVRELVIEKGIVVAIGKGNTPIGPGTTVVAHDSQSLLVRVQAGELAYVTWDLRLLGYGQIVPGYLVRLAVSGGPRLVADGQIRITSVEEQFRSDITQGRAPRTALGITADNQILLVTVDGRQTNHSIGMTLEQLAQLMLELGAVQAMNLDGGGSTTMVVDNLVVNRPSDGNLRAVSGALLVYTHGLPTTWDDVTPGVD